MFGSRAVICCLLAIRMLFSLEFLPLCFRLTLTHVLAAAVNVAL